MLKRETNSIQQVLQQTQALNPKKKIYIYIYNFRNYKIK